MTVMLLAVRMGRFVVALRTVFSVRWIIWTYWWDTKKMKQLSAPGRIFSHLNHWCADVLQQTMSSITAAIVLTMRYECLDTLCEDWLWGVVMSSNPFIKVLKRFLILYAIIKVLVRPATVVKNSAVPNGNTSCNFYAWKTSRGNFKSSLPGMPLWPGIQMRMVGPFLLSSRRWIDRVSCAPL